MPPDEAYPPAAVVNLLDPFGCAPDSITGDVGEVLAGSTVSLELVMAGEVLSTATATADAAGQADYTIPAPPDRFGPVVVEADRHQHGWCAVCHRDHGHHRRLPASAPSDGRLRVRLLAPRRRRSGPRRHHARGGYREAPAPFNEGGRLMADVIDDNATSTPSSSVDRRAALTKAAAAAGVVAWTTPVVQVLSTGTAHAQTVTGCKPVVTVAAPPRYKPGPSASAYQQFKDRPSCCSENSYFVPVLLSAGVR